MSYNRLQSPVLSPWSSFNRLASFGNELSQWFENSLPVTESGVAVGWNPPLDLYDNKESFVVTLELPGLKKEDISLSLHDGVLTVSGERKFEAQAAKGGSFRTERPHGKFERSIGLPSRVNPEGVTAAYKDGVLTVTLAKAEEAKPRHIEVSVS